MAGDSKKACIWHAGFVTRLSSTELHIYTQTLVTNQEVVASSTKTDITLRGWEWVELPWYKEERKERVNRYVSVEWPHSAQTGH